MNSLELTSLVTALANALACKLTIDEITLLASILVQLGDTLATIAESGLEVGTLYIICRKEDFGVDIFLKNIFIPRILINLALPHREI